MQEQSSSSSHVTLCSEYGGFVDVESRFCHQGLGREVRVGNRPQRGPSGKGQDIPERTNSASRWFHQRSPKCEVSRVTAREASLMQEMSSGWQYTCRLVTAHHALLNPLT